MPANKRIRKPPARTSKALLAESRPQRPDDLKKAVHRLEVEIAAAGRMASERRRRGGDVPSAAVRGGFGVQQRFTHAQARQRRARLLMQSAMFLTSTCLVAGAGAWLFRLWQEVR